MEEDRTLLELARDLSEKAAAEDAKAKSQGSIAKNRTYGPNINQYNRLIAEAKKKYPESVSISALPERIESVSPADFGPADYLSPIEHAKHTEVADASRRLVIALEAAIRTYPRGTDVLQGLFFDFLPQRN